MRRTQTVLGAALACIAVFAGQANAQNGDLLTGWTFETSIPTTAGPHASEEGPVAGQALGFHTSGATVYSNPVGNGSGESFSSNTWSIGDYYQFQTSTSGLSDLGVIFHQTRSSTGPGSFQFQYSTDGSSFTNFGDPYTINATTWSSGGSPQVESIFEFDLRDVAALDNQANVYFRLSSLVAGTATAGSNRVDNFSVFNNFIPSIQPPPELDPRLPAGGDVVLGLANNNPESTLKLISGDAVFEGGVGNGGPGPWSTTPTIGSVTFDNYGGTLHNANGNLLGLRFATGGTGRIYSFATRGSIPAPDGELIGNTGATDPVGHDGSLSAVSLSGISVSPNNSRVAVYGTRDAMDENPALGTVIVYDYTPGNTFGSGASLANGRQVELEQGSAASPNDTQGTAWLDNDTIVTFSPLGHLSEITDNGTSLTTEIKTNVTTSSSGNLYASIAYNSEVSPYIYAMASGFISSSSSEAFLYIFDPTNNYNLLNEVDLSNSIGTATARELALDADGNLFIGGFGGVINVVPNAAANAATLADNSSLLWYTSPSFGNFTGLDVGFEGDAVGTPGDFNGDGKVDAADYTIWRDNLGGDSSVLNGNGTGAATVVPADYDLWKSSFGSPGSGSAAVGAVPEPTSIALVLFGLAGLAMGRRRVSC